MKSERYLAERENRKKVGGSMKEERDKNTGKPGSRSLASLQGAVWVPHRRWGACSAGDFPASRGSPHVEPGVRNFLEILKPRPEWLLCMYNTNIPCLKRSPRPKFCNCLQQQELHSFSFHRKNYV